MKYGAYVLYQMRGAAPMVVRMGYFHSLSSSLIPTIVSDFYQKQDGQKLRFQFVEDTSFDIFSQLKERKLDLAFCTNRGEWADSVTILKQPLYLAVSLEHPLAKRSIVSFADYAREPLIVLDSGNSLRAQLDRAFQERGMIPNIVFEVRECNAALQYVALNFGVALLPMVPAMRSERVCAIPVEENGEALVRAVFLSWNREYPLSPPAQLVRNFIVQRYAAAMPA